MSDFPGATATWLRQHAQRYRFNTENRKKLEAIADDHDRLRAIEEAARALGRVGSE